MQTFLRSVLPAAGVYYAVVFNGVNKKHYACDTFEQLEKTLAHWDSQGAEVYFACSAFKEHHVLEYSAKFGKEIKKYRIKSNARAAKSLWLDMDIGPEKTYKTRSEGISALAAFTKASGLPAPSVISSGNGFHLYYPFDNEVLPEVWEAAAARLHHLCAEKGFYVDHSRTTDISSILRPVGTYNHKNKANPLAVQQVYTSASNHNDKFFKLLDVNAGSITKAVTKEHTTKASSIIDNILAGRNYPPVDANKVATRCAQMYHCASTRGNVSEPLWYAMLGILAFSENGEAFAQAWSSGHPSYSVQETSNKYAQWKSAAGPTTCDTFNRHNPLACDGCAHKASVKSPLQLGWVQQKLALPAAAQASKVPDPPYPYSRTPQGLMVKTKDDPVGSIFFDFDLFVSDIITDPAEGEQLVISYNKPHVGWHNIIAKSTIFTKQDKTWEYCASKGIYLRTESDAKHMTAYIRGYAAELQKIKASLETFRNFGWKSDGSFVDGPYIISKDGSVVVNPTLKQSIPVAANISLKGSLAAWTAQTQLLANPDLVEYAFALLCGFAAPLFKFTGHGGVMVNLVGETGVGKSTIQRMINSIWGDPEGLMLAAKDTEASKLARISYMNNLPVCIDEMGNMPADLLGGLLLKVTQGMDTRRLRQDGTEREQREWNTIVITSSNHSFIGKLSTKKANSEAELMRLVEVKAPATAYFGVKDNAIALNRAIMSNYGYAGIAFATLAVKQQGTIQADIDAAYQYFKTMNINFVARERFWEAALATALVAGRIAYANRLIMFDPEPVVLDMCQKLLMQRGAIDSQTLNNEDVISLFTNTNMNKALYIEVRKGSMPRYIREPRGDDLAVRIEVTLDASGNVSAATMTISTWHLSAFLTGIHEDYITFRKNAYAQGYLISESKKNLGEGTIYNTPAAKAITLNLLHPALNSMFTGVHQLSATTKPADTTAANVTQLRRA